jgi:ribA/ribD-fused uncharacterized protein
VTKIDRFDGRYGFLSNFYPSPLVLPRWHPAVGEVAPTVEHAFQAAKTEDVAQARLIVHASSPDVAKRLGRRVTLRAGWDQGRDAIMESLLRVKFAPGSELAVALLDTGEAELIEGNTWNDRYWGVCQGLGENRLGKLLMAIRSELASREAAA